MDSQQAPPVRLQTPLADEAIRALRVGHRVTLSGIVYSARYAAHKRIVEAIQAGHELPFPLAGAIIYYVGPAPTPPGEIIGPAGPTTASRMDSFTPTLLEHGLKGMIGKGRRDAAVRAALTKHIAVYLVAVGGAAALISSRITQVKPVAYADLGTEAISELTVENFPLVVANDIYGADLYEQGKQAYRTNPESG